MVSKQHGSPSDPGGSPVHWDPTDAPWSDWRPLVLEAVACKRWADWQRTILELLAGGANVLDASAGAKVSSSTVQRALNGDPLFRKAWHAAIWHGLPAGSKRVAGPPPLNPEMREQLRATLCPPPPAPA